MKHASVAALVGMALALNGALAQEMDYGQAEYLASCAGCHGERGRGNGPLALSLTVAPIDISLLAERNGGVFPFDHVTALIDGRNMVPGHGTRDMPVWGQRYLENDEEEFGEDGEIVTSLRIEEITAYVEYLQRSSLR
jgi:mono/diheme cytochrome c family protein